LTQLSEKSGARTRSETEAGKVTPLPSSAPAATLSPSVRPAAGKAKLRARHAALILSFLLCVGLPLVASAVYLWGYAADQYGSTVGFTVRKEEVQSSMDLLGGITKLTGSGTSDADILYDFVRSQEFVASIDAKIDLRSIFSRKYVGDPLFGFNPDGTIEDLTDFWNRQVKVILNRNGGVITLNARAFAPQDAHLIAVTAFAESSRRINALSDVARNDATRYAKRELEATLERLKTARQAVTEYRLRTRIVDPTADIEGQMGVVTSLESTLAQAMVDFDLLVQSNGVSDPRVSQLKQRIDVIQKRITEERRKFSDEGRDSQTENYALLASEYERLSVDREYAEQSYHAALASYDIALADAQRKSLYLAAHVEPTLAQKSLYPKRWTFQLLGSFFLIMAWTIGVLIYYSVRDRR
jgi:capsular polysaccharide transport system permease protein